MSSLIVLYKKKKECFKVSSAVVVFCAIRVKMVFFYDRQNCQSTDYFYHSFLFFCISFITSMGPSPT